MLAVQGPDARALVEQLADGELPKRFRTATLTVAGAPDVLVAGTGYTGEDGVELLLAARSTRPTVWDALTENGATPVGLGARDTLRLEVCFHLYGNDLSEDRGPIEAGLGWCCKEDTGFIGSEAIRAAARERHRRAARALRPHRPRHRPPGQPGRRRRRGDERDAVAVPEPGHRHGVPAGGQDRARHGVRDRRSRQARGPPRSATKPLYRKEG